MDMTQFTLWEWPCLHHNPCDIEQTIVQVMTGLAKQLIEKNIVQEGGLCGKAKFFRVVVVTLAKHWCSNVFLPAKLTEPLVVPWEVFLSSHNKVKLAFNLSLRFFNLWLKLH